MANITLTELRDSIVQEFYTIDDCYADPSLLTWEKFRATIHQRLEPIVQKGDEDLDNLALIDKFYRENVDITAILAELDKEIKKLQKKRETQEKDIVANQEKISATEMGIEVHQKRIQLLSKDNKQLQQDLQEVLNELQHIQPLANKKNYKSIYKELETQSTQKQIALSENTVTIESLNAQILEEHQKIGSLQQDIQRLRLQLVETDRAIGQHQQKKNASRESDDFQAETEAYHYLQTLFKTTKTAGGGEEYIQKQQLVPKNWRGILTNLFKNPNASPAGILHRPKGKSKSESALRLERTVVELNQNLFFATLIALKKNLPKGEFMLTKDESTLFLDLSNGLMARITFREKGKVIAAYQHHENANAETAEDDALFDDTDNSEVAKAAEFFFNFHDAPASENERLHTIHGHLSIGTCQDLYILFDKYVIEIDFVAAAVLL